jgi:hypothetical protein
VSIRKTDGGATTFAAPIRPFSQHFGGAFGPALTKQKAAGTMKLHRNTALVPEWRNWQTRQVQDLVLAREWRFESSFGHQYPSWILKQKTPAKNPHHPFPSKLPIPQIRRRISFQYSLYQELN